MQYKQQQQRHFIWFTKCYCLYKFTFIIKRVQQSVFGSVLALREKLPGRISNEQDHECCEYYSVYFRLQSMAGRTIRFRYLITLRNSDDGWIH